MLFPRFVASLFRSRPLSKASDSKSVSARQQARAFRSTAIAASAIVIAASLGAMSTSPASAATSLSLRVAGNQLVDANGNAVRLNGVNRSGTEYMCQQNGVIFDGPVDQAQINLMKSWGVNFVRIPLNELCWLDGKLPGREAATGANYRNAIVDYVNRLNANGIYTAVDLHFADPHDTGWAEQETYMANTVNSIPFWRSVASTFKNNKAMMFELFNEPRQISWQCLRDGCSTDQGYTVAGYQQLTNIVRATGATNPLILNGIDWGHDMSQFLRHLPTDSANQLVAGQHLYNFKRCVTEGCWNAEFKPVLNVMPMVATEIGENDCSGWFVTSFMRWLYNAGGDGVGVWAFRPGECPPGYQYGGSALLTEWSGSTTAYGKDVKNFFLANGGANTTPPQTTPPTTAAPTTTSTTRPQTTTTTRPPATTTTTQPPSSGETGQDDGYRMVTTTGVVYGFGSQAATYGNAPANSGIVSIANTNDNRGYWLAASDGRVFNKGNAQHFGDPSNLRLNGPIVSMSVTPSGKGYYLLGSDGGVFTYGDAQFYGSTGGMVLNKPALSITPTNNNDGYWFVAADGGVFTFGNAPFHGSTGDRILNQPVVGMAVNPKRDGYWLVARDGGIFTFGRDIGYYGSMGGETLNAPIADMSATASGDGYRLVSTDGGVFNFGNAAFAGSLATETISSPVRDITS